MLLWNVADFTSFLPSPPPSALQEMYFKAAYSLISSYYYLCMYVCWLFLLFVFMFVFCLGHGTLSLSHGAMGGVGTYNTNYQAAPHRTAAVKTT